MSTWTGKDAEHILTNPFYAINITPDLIGKHESLVSKAERIVANQRLIEEIGAKAWLEKLLAVLQGDFPRNPDEDETVGKVHTPAE